MEKLLENTSDGKIRQVCVRETQAECRFPLKLRVLKNLDDCDKKGGESEHSKPIQREFGLRLIYFYSLPTVLSSILSTEAAYTHM